MLQRDVRRALNPFTHAYRQTEVVDQDAELLQRVKNSEAIIGLYASLEHQLVGADALRALASEESRRNTEIGLPGIRRQLG